MTGLNRGRQPDNIGSPKKMKVETQDLPEDRGQRNIFNSGYNDRKYSNIRVHEISETAKMFVTDF
jgi:hypothetical protein